MDLDRGVLARVDRKLLAGLGQDERFQMVRVPVSPAKWSTWGRYCESVGVSMGRAIVTLIDLELVGVFGDQTDDHLPVFSEQAEEELARRQEQVRRREEKAVAVEARLSAWNARLRAWEVELEARERRVEFAANLTAQPKEAEIKVGRNERCPCGSGLKYKHCHCLSGRL
jgi:extradiol dioxygenase family protein